MINLRERSRRQTFQIFVVINSIPKMNKTIIELRYISNMVYIQVSEVFIIVLHSNQPDTQHWADDPWWSEFELSWKKWGFHELRQILSCCLLVVYHLQVFSSKLLYNGCSVYKTQAATRPSHSNHIHIISRPWHIQEQHLR